MNKNDRPLTDLRATAPGALEDVSAEAWEEFQALRAAQDQQFQQTRPNSLPGALSSRDIPAKPPPARQAVTLDQAMVIARRNNRACPLPDHWAKLHALLAASAPEGSLPPANIDGAAWQAAPSLQKRLRLKEQLEWADDHGCLPAVVEALSALPEAAWLHL